MFKAHKDDKDGAQCSTPAEQRAMMQTAPISPHSSPFNKGLFIMTNGLNSPPTPVPVSPFMFMRAPNLGQSAATVSDDLTIFGFGGFLSASRSNSNSGWSSTGGDTPSTHSSNEMNQKRDLSAPPSEHAGRTEMSDSREATPFKRDVSAPPSEHVDRKKMPDIRETTPFKRDLSAPPSGNADQKKITPCF